MPGASPPEGCSTNSNGAPGLKVLGTYSMKVRSRPPTVATLGVASPIGAAATAVLKSASAAPIFQRGSVVTAMISGLRFSRTKPYHAARSVHEPYARYLAPARPRGDPLTRMISAISDNHACSLCGCQTGAICCGIFLLAF